jgi:sec-independent protein translocase protein TatC
MSQEDLETNILMHLNELRKRIICVLVVFICSLVIGIIFVNPVVHYLEKTAIRLGFALHAFSIDDTFKVYIHIVFIIGVALTLPFLMYQVWAFVSPGLRPVERRAAANLILPAFLLFLLGISIGYYVVFPMIITFMTKFAGNIGVTPLYGIGNYFSFMFSIILPFAVLFEFPVVIMFLTWIRVLQPERLAKGRRYAYFILIIVASMISPPDFVSHLSVFIPLILLYEFSVFLSLTVYRKQLKVEMKWEETIDESII